MSKLYPQLPPADYRLDVVRDFRKELSAEVTKREKLISRNKRVRYGLARCSETLGGASAGLSGASLGLLVTGVGIPAAIPTAAVGLAAGIIDLGLHPAMRRLEKMGRRHAQLKTLAEANLVAVSRLLSRGLADGVLSDAEFQEVMDVKQALLRAQKQINKSAEVQIKQLADEFEAKLAKLKQKHAL